MISTNFSESSLPYGIPNRSWVQLNVWFENAEKTRSLRNSNSYVLLPAPVPKQTRVQQLRFGHQRHECLRVLIDARPCRRLFQPCRPPCLLKIQTTANTPLLKLPRISPASHAPQSKPVRTHTRQLTWTWACLSPVHLQSWSTLQTIHAVRLKNPKPWSPVETKLPGSPWKRRQQSRRSAAPGGPVDHRGPLGPPRQRMLWMV